MFTDGQKLNVSIRIQICLQLLYKAYTLIYMLRADISGSTSSRAFLDHDGISYDQTLISPCTTGELHQLQLKAGKC